MLYAATAPASLWTTWAETTSALTRSALDLGSAMTETAVAMMSGSVPAQPKAQMPASEPALSSRPAQDNLKPRSWYRSPYRSPFDPMFWMEPMGSGMPMPWTLAGLPGATAFTMRSPFMTPWLMKSPWEPVSVPERVAADLTSAAFAAYRSAGGYAVAQIVVPPVLASLGTPYAQGRPQGPYEAWMKAMFPWLPR